jgi:hypothetical protein
MLQIETQHTFAIVAIPIVLWLCSLLLTTFRGDLRHIPGPFFAKFSPLWRLRLVWNGEAHRKFPKIHEKYGPIVRIAPNVLAISDPAAIATIYGISSKFLKVL